MSTLIPDYNAAKLATVGRATVDSGSVSTKTSAVTTAAATTDTNWKKIGLWAVLLVSVLFLAAMAFSLLRKTSARP
ncbi:hypothetical protein D3C76_1774500 [compost metagenome]